MANRIVRAVEAASALWFVYGAIEGVLFALKLSVESWNYKPILLLSSAQIVAAIWLCVHSAVGWASTVAPQGGGAEREKA